jgi:hypothetical protein
MLKTELLKPDLTMQKWRLNNDEKPSLDCLIRKTNSIKFDYKLRTIIADVSKIPEFCCPVKSIFTIT